MEPAAAQTQAVERINQASNILVTVSSNPSVDQLAACIGLTLHLNRKDKHATAVFSGRVPSTIEFLQPEKTLDATITAHGRIVHDATVISVVAGKSQAPDLGQINWIDPAASSLCEMLVTMSDSLGQNLIDNQ